MEPKSTQDLIDRFLRNELSSAEKKVFMENLEKDAAFAQEVELQKTIVAGIVHEGNERLKSRLKKIKEDVKKPKKTGGRRRMIRIALASAAVITLLIFAYVFLTSKPGLNDLFAQYYEPYEASLTTRGSVTEELKAKAENAYRSKKFKNAIISLEEILMSEPNNFPVQLSLGNAYIQVGGYSNAEKAFNAVIESNNELFIDQANWFLAMTYLKTGRLEDCQNKLKLLSEKEGADYQKEAKELLKKME